MAEESATHNIDWDERRRRSEEDARTAPCRDFRHTLSGFDSRVYVARLQSAGQDIECRYTMFHDADGLQVWWFPLEVPEGSAHPLRGISYHGHKWNPSEGRSKQWDVVWCRFRLADVAIDPPAIEIVGWVREEVEKVMLAWLGVEPDLNEFESGHGAKGVQLPKRLVDRQRWETTWRAIKHDVEVNNLGPSAIAASMASQTKRYPPGIHRDRDSLSDIIKAGRSGFLERRTRKTPQ